jgi:hypothetical protein
MILPHFIVQVFSSPSARFSSLLLPQVSIPVTPPLLGPSDYCVHPHLPSFQPVRHLSSHLLQSKLLLPSLTLTALCASHIHFPNSSLLLTLGSLPSFIHDLKSSAHDQQGYILPNKLINCFVSFCCVREGRSGYAAVIV